MSQKALHLVGRLAVGDAVVAKVEPDGEHARQRLVDVCVAIAHRLPVVGQDLGHDLHKGLVLSQQDSGMMIILLMLPHFVHTRYLNIILIMGDRSMQEAGADLKERGVDKVCM